MRINEDSIVYSPAWIHGGFGDSWMCVNHLLRKSEDVGKPVLLSSVGEGWRSEKASLYMRLARCLMTTGQINVVERTHTKELEYLEPFGSPYFPTKYRWNDTPSNIISYQFDGVWNATNKNMTTDEENDVLRCCHCLGLRTVNVGGKTTIEYKIDVMSAARFHVGVESGMAHVAISVGVPCYIILNKVPYERVECLYRNRGSVPKFVQSARDFISLIRNSAPIMLM